MEKPNILFLCTGNSCRSQMAEGFAKSLRGAEWNVYSAGTRPQGVNPFAAKVMADAGVDIAEQTSNHVNEFDVTFDAVVTVCNAAEEACPVFPGEVNRIHRSFDDPPKLAETAKNEEEALTHYERVRDEIKEFVSGLKI